MTDDFSEEKYKPQFYPTLLDGRHLIRNFTGQERVEGDFHNSEGKKICQPRLCISQTTL